MIAVVKTAPGPGHVELRDMPEPTAAADQVKLEISHCGICGTDLHVYQDTFRNFPPVILGHEFVGRIVEEGAAVRGQADRSGRYAVLGATAVTCGRCAYCRWATNRLQQTVRAAANLGTRCVPVLSGGLAWHLAYPWPQRPAGLIDEAFRELARRWRPILDLAKSLGVVVAFELHPGSDLFDGHTFERFLREVGDHSAAGLNYDPSHFVLQQLDYLEFIKLYGSRIKGFYVKDAEFRPDGRGGVYGGYQGWPGRPGRFRSLGDGQVDFNRVFTLLTEAGYRGWAVLEWECCVKSPEQGAREGAPFISGHLIEATSVSFDDFAGGNAASLRNRKILGLS